MAILQIARMGNPILSQRARAVEDPCAPAIARLAADMIDTMLDAPGVGLAAPQIGLPLRMLVYTLPGERNDDAPDLPPTVLINPELEPLDDRQASAYEGCLSVPGLTGPVPRWQRIGYRALGLDGRRIEGEASGFHARVLQHEYDHLDGRLYLSRMTDLSRLAYVDELHRLLAAQETA